jgi:hypothetical protein
MIQLNGLTPAEFLPLIATQAVKYVFIPTLVGSFVAQFLIKRRRWLPVTLIALLPFGFALLVVASETTWNRLVFFGIGLILSIGWVGSLLGFALAVGFRSLRLRRGKSPS